MASRVWSHICDYATVDANRKATIMGEFDAIFTKTVPFKHPNFFVISKWSGSGGEQFSLRIRITSPSGRIVEKSPNETIIIKGDAQTDGYHTSVVSCLMVEFREFGQHSVEFVLNGIAVHYLPLKILQAPK